MRKTRSHIHQTKEKYKKHITAFMKSKSKNAIKKKIKARRRLSNIFFALLSFAEKAGFRNFKNLVPK
ncbi:MAG: hypothetical protein K5930_11485 [Treponemataceae bacterium]|nr:hypothetical protein [Treponemataceae bacterium]